MVGGHHRGGVIGSPVGVGHLEGPTTEIGHRLPYERITGHREPPAPQQAPGADGRVGQGHQRMQGGRPGVHGDRIEAERPGQMGHHRGRGGLDGRGHVGHRGVGRGDQHQISIGGGAGHLRARRRPAQHAAHLPAHLGQGGGHGAAGPPVTDDANRRHRWASRVQGPEAHHALGGPGLVAVGQQVGAHVG